MLSIITNPTMSWLPWVIFGSFLAIGALIGFWNGWRTATYFLGWNIVFLVAGVLLFDAFYGTLVEWAKGFMPKPDSSGTGPDIGKALEDSKVIIKPILGTILMVPVLLVGNFLAFLVYWFFRGNLKRRMKDNKQAQLSNLSARFIGSGVGVITAFPITVFATTASTLVSPQDEFNKVTDFMTSGMSFTKFSGTYEAVKSTQDAVAMIENMDSLKALGDAFGGGTGFDPKKIDDKSVDSIQKALNNKQLLPVLSKVAKSMMGGAKASPADNMPPAQDIRDHIKARIKAPKTTLFEVPKANQKAITDMMKQFIIKKDATNPKGQPFTDAEYEAWLEQSGLIKFTN